MRKLFRQCLRFNPALAIDSEPHHAIELQVHLQSAQLRTEVCCGVEALGAAARAADCDTVVAAIGGAAGLLPTLNKRNAKLVARELAPAGSRSGPKPFRSHLPVLRLLRRRAGASSLATGPRPVQLKC
jgi:hypothetical protein